MTETIPDPPDEATGAHPSEVLMTLLAALLAPMFLGVTAGDISRARLAAWETIAAYQARNRADLIAIARIIAYGLAALGSLSLSMDDTISVSMALRLHGNANALNRSAEQNRRALAKAATAAPQPLDTTYQAAVLANLEAAKTPVGEAPAPIQVKTAAPVLTLEDKRRQAAWASAMTDVAHEFTANIAHLPPAERKQASRRAALLSGCATDLLSGKVPPRPHPGALDGMIAGDPTR